MQTEWSAALSNSWGLVIDLFRDYKSRGMLLQQAREDCKRKEVERRRLLDEQKRRERERESRAQREKEQQLQKLQREKDLAAAKKNIEDEHQPPVKVTTTTTTTTTTAIAKTLAWWCNGIRLMIERLLVQLSVVSQSSGCPSVSVSVCVCM